MVPNAMGNLKPVHRLSTSFHTVCTVFATQPFPSRFIAELRGRAKTDCPTWTPAIPIQARPVRSDAACDPHNARLNRQLQGGAAASPSSTIANPGVSTAVAIERKVTVEPQHVKYVLLTVSHHCLLPRKPESEQGYVWGNMCRNACSNPVLRKFLRSQAMLWGALQLVPGELTSLVQGIRKIAFFAQLARIKTIPTPVHVYERKGGI